MATAKKKPGKTGASSGHITNLKQYILETFDIYAVATLDYYPAELISNYSFKKIYTTGPKCSKINEHKFEL